MIFELSKDTGIPLYVQIESRIVDLIQKGILKADEKLPATRELADQLAVHRNTVVQAYQELEVKGLVYSDVGRGTFVNRHAWEATQRVRAGWTVPDGSFSFDGLYSGLLSSGEDLTITQIENIVRTCSRPEDVISFASVVPDKHIFPLREFQNCTYQAIQRHGVDLLEMGDTQGFRPFLEYLPKFLIRRGMTVQADDVVVVNGIQQGLDLIGRMLINPGDLVLTEELTYRGALRVFSTLGATVIGIPVEEDGMRMDVLQTVLERQKVKFIYTVPTFQNPTGRVMSLEKRKRLLELAALYGVPVVEDQYANELRFDGRDVLPLYVLDHRGIVVAVSSFSKILFHGIRLGWIVSRNTDFVRKLTQAKRMTDWQSNYLVQGAILEFCEKGFFDKYLKKKLRILRDRRDAMFDSVQRHFPEECVFRVPEGGLFEWVETPPEISAYEALLETRKSGVLFTPKKFFAVHADVDNGMRLGFVSYTPDRIDEGIRILGRTLKQMLTTRRDVGRAGRNVAPVI